MRTRCRGEEGRILKEGDINKDEVAINVGRITTIILLKARITQEDTFRGFSLEVVLPNSGNMNKTDTTKDIRKEAKERLIR